MENIYSEFELFSFGGFFGTFMVSALFQPRSGSLSGLQASLAFLAKAL